MVSLPTKGCPEQDDWTTRPMHALTMPPSTPRDGLETDAYRAGLGVGWPLHSEQSE